MNNRGLSPIILLISAYITQPSVDLCQIMSD